MKFFTSIILTAILSFALCLFLPWWSIGCAAFIVTLLLPQSPVKSFFIGFIAIFILWGGLSYFINSSNGNLLASKISILILKNDSPTNLILISAFIGAIVGGFSGLSGQFFREMLIKKR